MSFSDLNLLKPTINMKKTTHRQSMAIYGHIISIIGGFFMAVSGLFNLFSSDLISIIGLLAGIFIIIIELDQYPLPPLKDPLNRGVAWILLGAFSFKLDLLAIILIFVGGACYLVYHSQ